MKIRTFILPQSEMRNQNTLGDYYYKDGELFIEVLDTGNHVYNRLILIHELIEELLTEQWGISEAIIDAFDKSHSDSIEPGLETYAPYRDEHLLAEGVERILCAYISTDWNKYTEDTISIFD